MTNPEWMLLLGAAALACAALPAAGEGETRPPGVVIAHSPAASGAYIGSPGLAVLPDGEYVASHDLFGPGSTRDRTVVYASGDRGRTWTRRAEIRGQWWSSLFVHRGALYLMGTSREYGFAVIRRSVDGGRTWTEPKDARSGLLLADGKYHCAPVPVVVHGGRLWRAMEDAMGPGGWGEHFRSFMMSAPEDADLLDAASWTCSNRIGRDPAWLRGRFGGWLEGNAVIAPDGGVVNVLRVDSTDDRERAAIVRVGADGKTAAFDPKDGFVFFPGGSKKFTIRFDPSSRLYWTLTSWVPAGHQRGRPAATRNTLALACSPDLRRWDVRAVLMHHPDPEKHGFQYSDWLFDGDDLIALVRTAYDDGQGGAHNYHDANYLTFHRVRGFRDLRGPLRVGSGASRRAVGRIRRLDPPEQAFYAKALDYRGIPIKAHAVVSDEALYAARDRLARLLDRRPDVVRNLRRNGVELHVLGRDQVTSDLPEQRYWKGKPFAGSSQTIDERTRGVGGRLASCGEENLLGLPGDPYAGYDICLHEFAHTIHEFGLSPEERERIEAQYHRSTERGLWKSAYAAVNAGEYWTELTMWYFGARGDLGEMEPAPAVGPEGLRRYDPEGFQLLDDLYTGRSLPRPRPEWTRGRAPVPFTAVRFHDGFWSARQRVYREKTLPHSWQYVQREIEDNEIAAGWKQVERGPDTPWNQANLHKVLETAAYALAQERDPALEAKVDGILAAVAGAQQPDGYVNALITVRKMTPWTNLDGQHEGYVAGHLLEAAVAHFQATGKRGFLDVACRLADHIHRYFVGEGHEGVCGHAELELALVRLYRVTGEKRYLALAQDWIERRGRPWRYTCDTPRSYFMDHLPIRQVPEVTGHAVRTMFYLTGVAEAANETSDAGLGEAARRLWRSATRRKMYVTGSVGSQEKDEGFGPDYDLPNRGYAESCAACGLLYFADAMFRLDGEAESVDVLERVLYNTVLHGISLDGTSTYYRNPLTDADNPRNNIWVCCPPCLSRTLLRVQDRVYAREGRDLYVNLYIGSTATIPTERGAVTLTQETDYPWDGQVRLTVGPEKPARFRLRLRLPGWCRGTQVRVNGRAVRDPKRERGYAVLDRTWKPGDVVELDMPMPVERVEAHPAVTEDRGMVALQRGPLVYGVEGVDNGGRADIVLPRDPGLRAERRPDLLGGVTVLVGRDAEGRKLTAVPFYALANRGHSRQAVWMRQEGKRDDPAGWGDTLYRPLDAGTLAP